MSGVAIIRNLLANAAGVTGTVSASNIKAGDLPIKTVPPAISIRQISSLPRLTLSMAGTKMNTDRVQVSPVVKGGDGDGLGYPGVKALLVAILAACPNQRGTVGAFSVDSILPDIEGPDLYDPTTDLHSGSRDFIVRWLP